MADLLGYLVAGLFIGGLTGLFGVGGGFIVTPVLHVVFGLPMAIAVGTGLCQMVGTSVAAMHCQRRAGNIDVKVALVMMGGSLAGVALGTRIVEAAKQWGVFTPPGSAAPVPVVDIFLMAIFLVTLLSLSAYILYESAGRHPHVHARTPLLQRPQLPLHSEFAFGSVSVVGLAYLGFFIGIMTGLLGIGGGVILVPALYYLVGMPMKRAIGTSLLFVFVSATFGTFNHSLLGNVRLDVALAILVSSTVGAQCGALISNRLGDRQLRRYFILIVLAGAGLLAYKLFRLFLLHA